MLQATPSVRTAKNSLAVASASSSPLAKTLRRCIRTSSGVVSNTSAICRWLSLNHQGLSILIHPETGNFIADHRDNALWTNERLELNLA